MLAGQFLALTFAISLAGFACIRAIPAARSPETPLGLPFWLIMVWGPTLAALILGFRDGQAVALLMRAVMVSTVPFSVWLLVLAPVALLIVLRPFAPGAATPMTPGMILAAVAFNLILGPLGEELGWRGFLQDEISPQTGWFGASLLIGGIWFLWHLPLWTIDAPHAALSPSLFAGHVLCYSVIIGAAHTVSGGSVLPAILIHLTVNLAANLAIFAGFKQPNAWFRASLPAYLLLAVMAALLVYLAPASASVAPVFP